MDREATVRVREQLQSLWPLPEPKQGETLRWSEALWPLEERIATHVVRKLRDESVNGKPRVYRPNVSEFLAMYRSFTRYRARERDEPDEPTVGKARSAWWITECRKILAGEQTGRFVPHYPEPGVEQQLYEPDESTWPDFEAQFPTNPTTSDANVLLDELF
jgi:hypothetical protein